MSENFQDYITSERARLELARGYLTQERHAIDERIAALDREFSAIEAYEAAKLGKTPRTKVVPSTRRPRDGSRRDAIVQLVSSENGLSRGEILTALGLKGDKYGEMSVSNALTSLVKSGLLSREGGEYFVEAPRLRLHEAAE